MSFRLLVPALLALSSASCIIIEIDHKSIQETEPSTPDAGGGGSSKLGAGLILPPIPCSIDLSTDPDNCGRCGRSCGGEACEEGRCPVRLLASTGLWNYGLALDATHAYWTAGGHTDDDGSPPYSVRKVPKQGGRVIKVFEHGDVKYWHPSGIAVGSEGHVYWTTLWSGGIYRATVDGDDLTSLATLSHPTLMTINGDSLYISKAVFENNGAITRVGTAGGKATLAANVDGPHGIVADDTFVYWTVMGPDGCGIWRTEGDNSGYDVQLAATSQPASRLALGGEYVFFHDLEEQKLSRVARDGSELVRIFDEPLGVPTVAADDERVYWFNNDGDLWSCLHDGSEPLLLATGQVPDVGPFEVDDQDLFWIVAGELRSTRK